MKILVYGINYSPELTGIGKYTLPAQTSNPCAGRLVLLPAKLRRILDNKIEKSGSGNTRGKALSSWHGHPRRSDA